MEGTSCEMVRCQPLDGRFVFHPFSPSFSNNLHVSIATPPRFLLTMRFSILVHHLSGPDKTKKTTHKHKNTHVQTYIHTYTHVHDTHIDTHIHVHIHIHIHVLMNHQGHNNGSTMCLCCVCCLCVSVCCVSASDQHMCEYKSQHMHMYRHIVCDRTRNTQTIELSF